MSEDLCTFAPANDERACFAPVAELVDALDLGSSILRCAGSSPVRRTERRRDAPKEKSGAGRLKNK